MRPWIAIAIALALSLEGCEVAVSCTDPIAHDCVSANANARLSRSSVTWSAGGATTTSVIAGYDTTAPLAEGTCAVSLTADLSYAIDLDRGPPVAFVIYVLCRTSAGGLFLWGDVGDLRTYPVGSFPSASMPLTGTSWGSLDGCTLNVTPRITIADSVGDPIAAVPFVTAGFHRAGSIALHADAAAASCVAAAKKFTTSVIVDFDLRPTDFHATQHVTCPSSCE